LEPDLDRRYQRASDIRADLRRAAREWESRQSRSEAAGRLWTVRRVAAAAAVAAALALALALMVSARPGAPPVAKTTQSVAVLPFKPRVAGDTDDTYLGLGIADALIMQLGAFKTVTVRPLSATSRFTADRDRMTAGRELRADLILDGAIQRAGDRLRVTVS